MSFLVTLGVSARHLHLSRQDMDVLFGVGAQLHCKKPVNQPGQFSCEEQVLLIAPKGELKLRIIGPLRTETQIELALSDAVKLGIELPIRNSGELENSPGAKLQGPKGEVVLTQGVIAAARHLHLSPATAAREGVRDGDTVAIRTHGRRSATFANVLARVGNTHADEIHLDTDEANAAQLNTGDLLEVIKE